ncbi:autotransporter outer membrane beta-barrel domain-containing protein [Advenella mimigardefordensis]|uniref:Putative extracellular serine protease n=1 Tax=Advenella mimigardefordensis (strain DSM 17166 / LMG 22922 / DPN7) TaxID=1247726 RepID=W0PIP8_ADVMD|nr:autotransporter serine protease [Advenella mimigardefordensis]AHG65385.1 putative extracellular serine protease [Advenella mimigardefordensis DPN7]
MRRVSLQLMTTLGFLAPGITFSQTAGAPIYPSADAEYQKNWGVPMINALPAYLKGYTGKGIIVAVVDTGLDVNHPEFQGRISSALRNFGKDKAEDDVSHGIDKADGSIDGHGTHVAGIIGAARNGTGMQGVAYESTILPLRAIDVESSVDGEADEAAIDYAVQQGAKVINGSYGPDTLNKNIPDPTKPGEYKENPNWKELTYQPIWSSPESLTHTFETLKNAVDNDVVLVFAAGNEYEDQPQASSIPGGNGMLPLILPVNTANGVYKFVSNATEDDFDMNDPKTYKFISPDDSAVKDLDFSELSGAVIAVVAVDKNGKITNYSNHCGAMYEWCLAAPGGDTDNGPEGGINSTWPLGDAKNNNNPYQSDEGTSMASPHVAGAAAVVRSAFPYFTAQQTIETLLTTTTTLGEKEIYGMGLLNLGNAINGPGTFRYKGVFDVDTQGYSSVWSNSISGEGDLTKRGQGVLTLTGNNTYTGGTSVVGGTLGIEGNTAGSVSVSERGVLAGAGVVGTVTLSNGGTISPGSTLDATKVLSALKVAGDLIQGAGSSYLAQIADDGRSDLIDVSGKATISDTAAVVIQPDAGSKLELNRRYTLLTAAGGVDGRYGSVMKPDTLFVNMNLVYDARNMFLDLARSSTAFEDVADTHNQRTTGRAIENLGSDNQLYQNVLFLSGDQARNAFDQLSGEAHASIHAGLIEDSHFLRDTENERLRDAFGTSSSRPTSSLSYRSNGNDQVPEVPGEVTLWGKGFGAWSRINGNDNAASLRRNTGGFFLGGDRLVGQSWRLGVMAGYSHTSVRVRDRNASGSSDNFHLGLYVGTSQGAWRLRSGLGYTWHRIKTDRSVAFGSFSDKLSSRYDAGTFQAFGELGYRLETRVAAIEPYANLSYVRFKADRFTEDGGAAALTNHAKANSNTYTTIGLRATSEFALGKVDAQVHGGIGWRHAFGRVYPKADFSFGDQPSFNVQGVPIARNAAVLEAGLDMKIGKTSTLGIAYQGQFGSGAREHSLQARLALRF